MNTPDPVAGEPSEESVQPAPAASAQAPEAAEPAPHVPVVSKVEREVTLVRGVRYGRIIVSLGIAGVIVAMMASLMIPVAADANYTIGQIVGFMALIGGVIGLAVGGILSIILTAIAKRRTGTGVAIQTDVR